ncbi:GCG_CRPN prefix-to-repeats domain-containing protein [Rhodoblastus sp.]|uniref:GCG_CRPN prefix-to-repeats domain-containing protein n=1 Tax=Rhodoblastus sp. TaxID=1962975 RepID=UPI0035B29B85
MTFFGKGFVVAAALFGASLGGAATADAMPIAPVAGGIAAPIEQAGWRCGPGWHVNPWGRCVPNGYGYGGGYYAPRPVYRPYGFYGPRPYYRRPYYGGYRHPYYGGYRRW